MSATSLNINNNSKFVNQLNELQVQLSAPKIEHAKIGSVFKNLVQEVSTNKQNLQQILITVESCAKSCDSLYRLKFRYLALQSVNCGLTSKGEMQYTEAWQNLSSMKMQGEVLSLHSSIHNQNKPSQTGSEKSTSDKKPSANERRETFRKIRSTFNEELTERTTENVEKNLKHSLKGLKESLSKAKGSVTKKFAQKWNELQGSISSRASQDSLATSKKSDALPPVTSPKRPARLPAHLIFANSPMPEKEGPVVQLDKSKPVLKSSSAEANEVYYWKAGTGFLDNYSENLPPFLQTLYERAVGSLDHNSEYLKLENSCSQAERELLDDSFCYYLDEVFFRIKNDYKDLHKDQWLFKWNLDIEREEVECQLGKVEKELEVLIKQRELLRLEGDTGSIKKSELIENMGILEKGLSTKQEELSQIKERLKQISQKTYPVFTIDEAGEKAFLAHSYLIHSYIFSLELDKKYIEMGWKIPELLDKMLNALHLSAPLFERRKEIAEMPVLKKHSILDPQLKLAFAYKRQSSPRFKLMNLEKFQEALSDAKQLQDPIVASGLEHRPSAPCLPDFLLSVYLVNK